MPKKANKRLNSMCTIKRNVRKNKNNITKTSVKRMLTMTDPPKPEKPSSSTDPSSGQSNIDDFLSTGRTGRRNALPDILNDHSLVTSSELPSKIESLTTEDKDNTKDPNAPSTSKKPKNNDN